MVVAINLPPDSRPFSRRGVRLGRPPHRRPHHTHPSPLPCSVLSPHPSVLTFHFTHHTFCSKLITHHSLLVTYHMKHLTRLTLTLTIAFTLLLCAARFIGQTFPSPMLAYGNSITGNLHIMDWRSRHTINLGSKSALNRVVNTWSADGRLAFISDTDGNSEIYLWDGEALTNISQHPAEDASPRWSADDRLTFVSERDGNREIYVWDGASFTNLTQNPANDFLPTWNTDGHLAFVSDRNGDYEIYVWDGTSFTNISQSPDHQDSLPLWWSP